MGKGERQSVELDGDVLALARKREARTMSPAERRRAERKARQVSVTWVLDREVARMVREVGEALEVCPGGAASRLLLAGLQQYADGEIDFEGVLTPSRSARYWWAVELETGEVEAAVRGRLKVVLDDGEI